MEQGKAFPEIQNYAKTFDEMFHKVQEFDKNKLDVGIDKKVIHLKFGSIENFYQSTVYSCLMVDTFSQLLANCSTLSDKEKEVENLLTLQPFERLSYRIFAH
ncbi:hypothetical protein KXD93_25570 [Mucilaginibacter sp. BJC16-A38]|uniref:hypothetical protein n=1 Tax=Mucilaginibacter phenanthrenivorans TaxID=1234842 RepID=UPI002158001A|nr:hypothetical protein [Mucilaginibacter phenanthrenivorans]MCR8561052.1 hypothetical protein [Mucilaginibacter phenanthrenivorans]